MTSATAARLCVPPREAAAALSISERKLWSLTASGEIPRVRLGRCVRYRVESLREYLEAQEKGGQP